MPGVPPAQYDDGVRAGVYCMAADPIPEPLIDRFGRRIDYLRLSVTDRCDLRCSYCMPKGFCGFEDSANWLSFVETERLIAVFGRLGVRRVRITGGEPLLRRNLAHLVARLHRLAGIEEISLSTNATQLERHASALSALDRRALQRRLHHANLAAFLCDLQSRQARR